MRKSLLRLLPIVLIALGGCHTTYHYAEFIQPSNIYIPSEIYRIGVIQRGATPEKSMSVYMGGLQYATVTEIPHKTAEKTLEILTTRVEEIGRYSVVDIPFPISEIDQESSPQLMFSPEVVDSLAREYDVDGIISLDEVDMTVNTTGSVDVVTVNDALGMPVRVPEFSRHNQVTLTLFWRFYDTRQPRVLDEFGQTYDRSYTRVSYDEDEINEFRNEDVRINQIAEVGAMDYFNRVAPHWVTAYRTYYRSGSDKLEQVAANLERDGNWEAAAEWWKRLAQSEDEGEKFKAMYNMAVASEMLGSPRVAKNWLEKAIRVKPKKIARNYLEKIEEQILVQEVVNRQLGLE